VPNRVGYFVKWNLLPISFGVLGIAILKTIK
jgi:hypothetical protein